MSKISARAKRLLASAPKLQSAAKSLYHYAIFYFSKVKLRAKYPTLKFIHYKERELVEQRRSGFQSQFGQDFFIFTEFFRKTTHGFYLDIGCNQPQILNNTYYFEKNLAWDGLAFDPISIYESQWREHRRATFVLTALGSTNREEEFIEIENFQGWGNMMSGFKKNVRAEDLRMGFNGYKVKVQPLTQVLNEFNIDKIDFASIDVEGAELEILEGIDFNSHSPSVLLVENYQGFFGRDILRKFLINHGYKYYARIWICDDVFVKNI